MTTVQYQRFGNAPGQNRVQPNPSQDTFPYRRHQTVGWIQIILGIGAIIIQMINIGVLEEKFHYGPVKAASGIWTGLMFILVGAFGAAMKARRKNSRECQRITVMVLAVINACIFAPSLIIAACMEIILVCDMLNDHILLICPSILLVVGLAEFVVTIVAASFCCCCNYSTDTGTAIQVTTYASYPVGLGPGQVITGYPVNQPQFIQVNTTPGLPPPYGVLQTTQPGQPVPPPSEPTEPVPSQPAKASPSLEKY